MWKLAASPKQGQTGPQWLGGDVGCQGYVDGELDTLTTSQNVTISRETSR